MPIAQFKRLFDELDDNRLGHRLVVGLNYLQNYSATENIKEIQQFADFALEFMLDIVNNSPEQYLSNTMQLKLFTFLQKTSVLVDKHCTDIELKSTCCLSSELGLITNIISKESIDMVKNGIWEAYRLEQTFNQDRKEEMRNCKIKDMRYFIKTVGVKPNDGYPVFIALHGGGEGEADFNDVQWEKMKNYYSEHLECGIYIAPRGITNTWNLHSVPESLPIYDRLIENLCIFENINLNKVYLLGFSAGSDGTYQIISHMPDRFAAANASAGHPNNCTTANWFNLPIILQVGSLDDAYNRNTVTVDYDMKIKSTHQTFIHYKKPHNFIDNGPLKELQPVYSDNKEWITNSDAPHVYKNTNAPSLLINYTRNHYPSFCQWDTTTRAIKRSVNSHYWISTNDNVGLLSVDLKKNKIFIQCNLIDKLNDLKILLNQKMITSDTVVTVQIYLNGIHLRDLKLECKMSNLLNTLLERGDPYYMFEYCIYVYKNKSQWDARQ